MARRYRDAFALRVDGDSMAPRITDGDIIVVSGSVPVRDGAPAVVQLKDQIGVTCKILRRAKGKVHLIAANEAYPTTVVETNQVVWSVPVLYCIRLR